MARRRSRSARRVPRPRFPLRARLRASLPYWSGVLGVAALTAMTIAGLVDRAAEAEARFGRTRPVVVARHALFPGAELRADAAHVVEWPESLVPDGALSEVPDGRVVVAHIAQGETILTSRLSGPGASGAAGLVPPGHRAMALPMLVEGLPARPGDRVDVYISAGGDPTDLPLPGAAPPGDAEATTVAEDAVVVEVGDRWITVAVSVAEAPAVAAAVPSGTLIVALSGPPG